ncbi:MAG: flagellar filament capping protein FliD [Deltaproteobacteria bacterium]|nr:flagellar filament capping protein FliD [Deltaproteobacteria bacterium]
MSGTITALGLGSGIDLQGTLDSLREIDEAVITEKETKKSEFETQLNEFTVLQEKLLDMKSYALELSLQSTFIARNATVSDESVLALSATEGATVQSTAITVEALADKSSWISAGAADKETVVFEAGNEETTTFSYQVGDIMVNLDVAGGTTLTELADLINNSTDNPGVTASLVDNGDSNNPYQLVLQADETGEKNRITILTQLAGLNLTEKGGADGASLNAQFSVGGIDYQRQSNTITDVIASVQFTLQGTGSSTISVSNDEEKIKELITNLVSAYNEIITEITANTDYDTDTEELGILASTGFADLPYSMQTLMNTFANTGTDSPVTSIFDLGLSYESDGTITIDEEVLAEMTADHFDDVALFFNGDEDNDIEGLAEKMSDFLRNAATEDEGICASETSLAEQRIDSLEEQIERDTERLDKKYEILAKQYAALDTYLNEMENMSDYLTQTFASISGSSD